MKTRLLGVPSLFIFLVLCVFAIAGSATGWIGKIIMTRLAIDQAWLWTAVYIVVITLIWPINVLIVSIPFGQFLFFPSVPYKNGEQNENTEPIFQHNSRA